MRMCWGVIAAALLLASCSPTVRVKIDNDKPIHIVMDINVRLDRQLDDFFDFENEAPSPDAGAKEGVK